MQFPFGSETLNIRGATFLDLHVKRNTKHSPRKRTRIFSTKKCSESARCHFIAAEPKHLVLHLFRLRALTSTSKHNSSCRSLLQIVLWIPRQEGAVEPVSSDKHSVLGSTFGGYLWGSLRQTESQMRCVQMIGCVLHLSLLPN